MMNENKLNEDILNLVSGGILREGWDETVYDMMALYHSNRENTPSIALRAPHGCGSSLCSRGAFPRLFDLCLIARKGKPAVMDRLGKLGSDKPIMPGFAPVQRDRLIIRIPGLNKSEFPCI